jgi:glucose-1-phosphate thymidylyltransferase
MKGIILAGGTGSRLGILTKTLNKHVLNVYDRPMICWPLRTLRDNGIEDITIVSTPQGVGQIAAILGSGREYGCQLTYRVQEKAGGIADAMLCGYSGVNEEVAVILGDNIFLPSPVFHPFESRARCFVKRIDDREKLKQFGVPVFGETNYIEGVEEKPENPQSSFAITGLYVLGAGVWMALRTLKVGKRGELEITDLLDFYAKATGLPYTVVDGFWGDAGTVEGIAECSKACAESAK